MPADSPQVSVIIPVYNGGRYIAGTVRSVLAQTDQRFEIIAVNDGSTDNSAGILAGLKEQFPDKLTVLTVENGGVSRARNAGVRVARGEFLAFIDQDDLWTPEKLARQIALHGRSPAPVVTFTNEAVIGEDGEAVSGAVLRLSGRNRGMVFEELLFDNFIPISSVMIPRDLFRKLGGFSPGYALAEDFDLLLRAAENVPFDFIDEPLLLYRQHPGSGTYSRIGRLTDESFSILTSWKEKRPDVFSKNRFRFLVFRLKFLVLNLKVRASSLFHAPG